jgi:hypothetical protein
MFTGERPDRVGTLLDFFRGFGIIWAEMADEDKKKDCRETDGLDSDNRSVGEKLDRRKLLKLGVYTTPAIIGSLFLSRNVSAQTGTCGPSTCHPTCPPVAGCDPPGHN